jgi:hypothetical protein
MNLLHFMPLPGVFAPPPRAGACATCGIAATLRCAGCREESTDYHGPVYCGVAHQRVDWPRHKADCLERHAAGLDVAAIVFSLEPGGRHRVRFGADTRELTAADMEKTAHVRTAGMFGSPRRAGATAAELDLITVAELGAGLPTYEGRAGLALDAGGAAVALVGASSSRDSAHGGACVETWKTSRPDGRLRVADVVALVMHRYESLAENAALKYPSYDGWTHRVATLDGPRLGDDTIAPTDATIPKAIQIIAHVGQRPTYITVPA